MKFINIISLTFIALLAACKSTVPQSERLLEERVSTAQENSSSSLELPVKSDKDSTVIFERIKSYVFDSVMTDMTTNFTVMEHICCGEVPSDLLSWCEVKYDSTQIHLNMTSRDETYQFRNIVFDWIQVGEQDSNEDMYWANLNDVAEIYWNV